MESEVLQRLRVLIVGNGGREHALAWKLSQSSSVDVIYVAPGNGGTAQGLAKVQNVEEIKVGEFAKLVDFARNHDVNLVVPGPEQPLVDGIVDYFHSHLAGTRVFGPSKQAAILEGSKAFAKDFMRDFNVPTARYRNFQDVEKARDHVRSINHEVVIKVTGLAAGKGVILPSSKEEALKVLDDIMVRDSFGSAGAEVVIEERLVGQEISILSFCDGYTARSLPPAQDHKQVFDGDRGPNTGGMGCFGPAEIATPDILDRIHREVVQPTLDGMRRRRTPFVGLLFTGYMLTEDGPKLLEYNARFGDPETQTLLPLMEGDLAATMIACTDGYLDSLELRTWPQFSTTVIAAAGGYPGSYPKGQSINIERGPETKGIVFHAGTSLSSGELKSAGGRVIAATSAAATLEQSVQGAYDLMRTIRFENMHYRKDIAHNALAKGSKPDAGLTYAAAGVSITSGNDLVNRIRPLVAKTARPGSTAQIGGFGGVFSLKEAGYEVSPELVTGTDGVGSKLMIAHALKKYNTIGIDLVAMNVNDIVVQGAEPLYLTDVYSCNKLDVDVATAVVEGVCKGCIESGCALLGGETAEMGLMFRPGEYDITAATTGAIAQGQSILPDTTAMREGDVLLGLASSGCHSNGFSLIRKIIERQKLTFHDPAPWSTTTTTTVGDELLVPTRIYVKPLLRLVRAHLIKGMAHITGGGLVENVPRMLPGHLAAAVDARRWPLPPVMRWLKAAGNVSDQEFSRVFNTGIGMVLVVDPTHVEQAFKMLEEAREVVYTVGRSTSRGASEGCVIEGMECWN